MKSVRDYSQLHVWHEDKVEKTISAVTEQLDRWWKVDVFVLLA